MQKSWYQNNCEKDRFLKQVGRASDEVETCAFNESIFPTLKCSLKALQKVDLGVYNKY
jgi:hypothetical protein